MAELTSFELPPAVRVGVCLVIFGALLLGVALAGKAEIRQFRKDHNLDV